MQEARVRRIKDKKFISKNTMPDNLLRFVPKCNVSKLNTSSRKRYLEIMA